MSLQLKCHQNWNITKTKTFHQNWNFTKTEMSLKLKCHQNWNVTKTEMSPKLKCYQNWNVTITEMLQNLKMSSKSKSKSKSKSRRSTMITLVLFVINLVFKHNGRCKAFTVDQNINNIGHKASRGTWKCQDLFNL